MTCIVDYRAKSRDFFGSTNHISGHPLAEGSCVTRPLTCVTDRVRKKGAETHLVRRFWFILE